MKNRFNFDVEKILLRSGWFAGRHVEIQGMADWLRHGNTLHSEAEKVLNEFDGLSLALRRDDPPGIERPAGSLNIGFYALDCIQQQVEVSERILKSKLTPVADLDSLGFYICVDENGRVFELFDDLCYFAPDFDEALERVLCGRFHAPLPPELFPGTWPMIYEYPGREPEVGPGIIPPRSAL